MNQKQIISYIIAKYKKQKLDINNKDDIKQLEDSLKRVFLLELEELKKDKSIDQSRMSNIKLNFVGNLNIQDLNESSRSSFAPGEQSVITLDTSKMFKDLTSNDSKVREVGVMNMYIDLIHELRHHKQYTMTKFIPKSKEELSNVKDFALRNYLKFYNDNYWESMIENDAHAASMKRYQEIMGKQEILKDYIDLYEAQKHIARYKYGAMLQERDDMTAQLLGRMIKKNPGLIQQYGQALLIEYNPKTGERRSVEELISNAIISTKQIRQNQALSKDEKLLALRNNNELHYELIYRTIRNYTPEQIANLEQTYGKRKMNQLYEYMIKYFEREKQEKLQHARIRANVLTKRHKNGEHIPGGLDVSNPQKEYEETKYRLTKYYHDKMSFLALIDKDIDIRNIQEELYTQRNNIKQKAMEKRNKNKTRQKNNYQR